ncbi:MAG: SEC-C metal-binding domain-containing protein [Kofleriaceae bacterium]
MPATVVDALRTPYRCEHACHDVLSLDERVQAVEALYRFDDAMRGWDYEVAWDLGASVLWKVAQAMDSPGYRYVTVRDTACVYSRLVGFCTHELIHALTGDVTAANYGIPFGLPYRVPEEVAPADEAAYLHGFNQWEARAWAGMPIVAHHLFGIGWPIAPARDVGTYGLPGGSALVEPMPGYRCVAHYDSGHHRARYYALARALEEEARGWFTAARLAELEARFVEAETRGRQRRPVRFPPALELARLPPRVPGRNDLCPCGSTQKFKKCCGA